MNNALPSIKCNPQHIVPDQIQDTTLRITVNFNITEIMCLLYKLLADYMVSFSTFQKLRLLRSCKSLISIDSVISFIYNVCLIYTKNKIKRIWHTCRYIVDFCYMTHQMMAANQLTYHLF